MMEPATIHCGPLRTIADRGSPFPAEGTSTGRARQPRP